MALPVIWRKARKVIFRLGLIFLAFIFFLTIYLDSMVKEEFKQKAWSIPAKVFARPLSFAKGENLSLDSLLLELKLLGYRQKVKAVNQGEFERYGNTLVIYTRRFKFWDGMQPAQVLELTIEQGKIVSLKDFETRKSVNFLRLDPFVLGSIQTGHAEDRILVTLNDLPEHFLSALLNTEDRDFYEHWGISLKGIARAAWSNFSEGELRQGGSTLTQQLMKSHFLTRERSLWRKFKEAILATLTEVHYTKDTILEAYINEVFLGQDHSTAIHGFARASEFYFDRPLKKLNLNQIALLVGMVKGPSLYNPRRNPDKALQRRNLVLKQMLAQGLISDEDYENAVSRNLQVVTKPSKRTSRVPAFMGYIKQELKNDYSLETLSREGLRLFTSLDPVIQRKAENALSSRLAKIEQYSSEEKDSLQGAIVVSDIKSGDILAMVGDRHPDYVGFNRAVHAYRQTGSVIKPFVYLTALAQPERFNLITPMEDRAFSLEGSDGSLWTPKNYDGKEHGQITLKEGLINSYNLTTARLALEVGVENVVETIEQAGFKRELEAFPSIALGAKEMSPLEVLRLYQTIANDGIGVSANGIIAVQNHTGELLQRFPRKAESRIDRETAFILKYLLSQVAQRGTAKSLSSTFPDKSYAGKTGTTNDLRDSWFAGFGGRRLAVAWVGRDDNKPTRLTGATGALRVWQDLFTQLKEPSIVLEMPEAISMGYEKRGGLLSLFTACSQQEVMPFFSDHIPVSIETCD
ncbi:penicillin-binding protein 1B [Aliikangiella sp. G2MR2-5]|uniref:penicillin-binding protein 1B n=1 Tax=Aliikangiella sp. G2MR2-5 TaxID=2788943 RepID=UPI0018AC56A6|nr:penicillin-binding protein 1B [Aliikangiella sp. G2MR2-5]